MLFKVDFMKAYDSVSWDFLDYMLSRMGFPNKWRVWIRECLVSASVSVLVNGSPTQEFRMTKGIRQGDPMAPFLFLIVAEGLRGLVRSAVEKNIYSQFVFEGNEQKVGVSHIQYADDTILVGDMSSSNVRAVKCILSFELAAGLRVNFHKSGLIGIKANGGNIEQASTTLNCKVSNLPFKFLGILVGANQRRSATWVPLINSLQKWLQGWRNKYLSFGGRVILINAVLSALPVYYLSMYKAPKRVLNKITQIQRRFLWGGNEDCRKICWVKWEVVCRAREDGGLGIRNIKSFNLALLGKWRWRFFTEKESLWSSILRLG